MEQIKTDGGRRDAGFRGQTGDCVTRAIAIATGIPYQTVYKDLTERCLKSRLKTDRKSACHGVRRRTYQAYLSSLGWTWHPCMEIGSGCTVHLKKEELPSGRLIVRLSGHLAAVIDGILYDLEDCSRNGTRCVYGYYQEESR